MDDYIIEAPDYDELPPLKRLAALREEYREAVQASREPPDFPRLIYTTDPDEYYELIRTQISNIERMVAEIVTLPPLELLAA